MAEEVTVEVSVDLDGERVDKALATILGISRTRSRLLVDRGVTIDGVIAKAGDRVSAGSILVSARPATDVGLEPEPVEFGVLYEDSHVVVVDKPPGLIVHPGSGNRRGTLAAGLLFRYPDIAGVGAADRWGLVHRLDKETSGALLVARTVEAFDFLSTQMRSRRIERDYVTLVDGHLDAPTGTIDAPIGRDPIRPTRRAVVAAGKHARTHYETQREYRHSRSTLLRVSLETGRTHQIRVHFASIDHPVIGDRLYGQRPTHSSSPRVFLHAAKLSFRHPEDERPVTVVSDLPDDLASVLEVLDGEEPD